MKKKTWIALTVLLLSALVVFPFVLGCGGTATTTTTVGATTTTVGETTTSAPAETTTTAPAETTTTAAGAAYDIKAIVAGISADPTLAAMVPAKYQTNGVTVASDIPYMPWEGFVGDTSQPTGLDYDLSQALGAKLGIKFDFIKVSFDSIIIGVQSGKYDLGMSSIYDNKSRQKTCDFVDYAQDAASMVVLKGNPKNIGALDTLAGLTVGCEKGTTEQVILENLNKQFQAAGKPTMTIDVFPDQPSALLAVQSGKVVGDLTDHSTAEYNAMTTNNGNTFEVVVDPAAPSGYEPQPDGIEILKSNTQLRDALQKALQALIDDGTYKTMIDHYGILPVTSATINAGTAPGT